jgi:hypothetical protein
MSEKNDFGPWLKPEKIIELGKIQICIEKSNHQKPVEGKIINFADAKKKIEAKKQK